MTAETNGRKKYSLKQVFGVVLLLSLIGANVFFLTPTNSALSEGKRAAQTSASETARAHPPEPARDPELTKVFGDKNTFGTDTVDDDAIQPLPLDLVEEKGSASKDKKPDVPESVKSDGETGGDPAEEIPWNKGRGGADTTTLLNGSDIEISTLVKAFSKLTKRNYIVDNNVKGKVTVHLTSAVSVEEAIHIFESILLLKGFTTVPIGKNIWKVIATKDAQKSTIPFGNGKNSNPSEVLVTQLIRLKYTQANELQSVLNQFVSKDGIITSFAGTNSVIVIDSEANIKRITELVNQLDVPAVDQDITIIPVLHAEAKDVAEKLKQILGEDKDAKDAAARAALNPQAFVRPATFVPPVPGQPATGAQQNYISSTANQRTLPLKIIADERTNSIIVVADALLTTKVRALCEQLDSKTDQSGGKFYVYRLKHADAEELADILNGLVGGGGGGSGSGSKKKEKTSGSSLSRSTRNSGSNFGSGFGSNLGGSSGSRFGTSSLTSALTTPANPADPNAKGPNGKVAFEGEISITADSATNSLVINASKTDYEKVKQVIDELDVRRQQVLVEATILQVSLDKAQGVGVEWSSGFGSDDWGAIGQNNYGGLTNLIANPTALSDLTIAAASSGSIVLPGGIALPSQAILISALSKNTNVNVLSSPTILATDNEEAEIVVGQNVPFITGTGTNATNLNNTFNSIERQDVGITLRITPQISAGGFVVLKIFVEVSSVVSGTQNDPNGPTTSVNTTETTVEVKSNQMIVTGGLISDEVSDATRGIPYLEDVPILGNLFKRTDSTRRRNNLLIFITPKVISDQFLAREATKTHSSQMSSEIDKLNSQPDRREVLQNESMDQVVEEVPPPDSRPSTVREPKGSEGGSAEEQAAKERTKERLERLFGTAPDLRGEKKVVIRESDALGDRGGASEADGAREDEGSELNFTVKPELPGARTTRESRVSLKDRPSSNVQGKTFVVLRQLGGEHSPPMPFRYADQNRTIGLVVMGSQQSAPGRFFSAGRRYLYRTGDEDVQFVCLGLFASPGEAATIEPSLGTSGAADSWYALDAAQSLRLGKNEWKAL